MTAERIHGAGYLARVCLVAALGGLLFGYDTAVISGAIGFLQEHWGLSAALKGWAAASALVGCVLGVALAGFLSDRFGRRRTLVFAAVLFLVSAVGTALPRSFEVFVAFRILGGLGVGAASMTSPMYIAEISPARIRGRMVSVNQLAIVSGILLVYLHEKAAGLDSELRVHQVGYPSIDIGRCPLQEVKPLIQDLVTRARTYAAEGKRVETETLYEIDKEATCFSQKHVEDREANFLRNF